MEIAGLAFGVLGALDICVKACHEIKQYVQQYKSVASDFESASCRLAIYKTTFDNWIELWNIKDDTPEETFYRYWGRDGANTIKDHLECIRRLCEKTSKSQAKYKRAFEKNRSKLRVIHQKIRFTLSGRTDLEENLSNLRLEFGWVRSEAEEFFIGRNPGVSVCCITRARICGIESESGMIDRAISVQQTSTQLFKGLRVELLTLDLDLALQPDYVSKRQFKDLHFNAQKLHTRSAKLPVLVNKISSQKGNFSHPSVFVFEAVKKDSFRNPDNVLQTKSFDAIVQSTTGEDSTESNESFLLKFPSGPEYAMYRFLVHSTGTPWSQSPEPNSISLQQLFDNIPRRNDRRRTFAIAWQFDLAYTLAVSVLNLQGSGWLNSLDSRNIYQNDSPLKSTGLSVKVCGNSFLAPKETSLEKLFRGTRFLKPEIFRLGVIMLEIGLARSVSKIFKELEDDINKWSSDGLLRRLFCDLEHSVCLPYTEITKACLEGNFELDEELSEASFMRSYISTVIEPLKFQCEAMCGNRFVSRKGESNWSARILTMKEKGSSESTEKNIILRSPSHRQRKYSTWREETNE